MIEYLTVKQAAVRMQVSPKTMYGLFREWRASGGRDGVRHAYVGRKYVCTPDDLQEYYRRKSKAVKV